MSSNSRRIQKDIRDCQATHGIKIAPRNEKINELWVTIRFTLNEQEFDIPALVVLKADYPISPPSVGFPVDFPYSMGATMAGRDEFTGMTVLCLNILGNFDHVHTEWKRAKGEGWSPSMSLAAVMVQLQSILIDLDAELSPFTKRDLITRLERFKKHHPECFPDADSVEDTKADSAKAASTKTGSASTEAEPDMTALSCSITGMSITETVMGYGVSDERGALRTPGEPLSLVAFRDGIRVSSTKSRFQHFLPLQGPGEDWIQEAERSCATIMSQLQKKSSSMTDPVLVVYGKLLNGILVSMVTGEISDSERFIEAFVRLRETLRVLIGNNASRRREVHQVMHDFIEDDSKRLKDKIPDVGELLAIYSCCSSTETSRFYDAFIDECTVRWVFWLVKNRVNLQNKDVFEATEFSRNLCLFQTRVLHTLEHHDKFQDCIQALDAFQKNWREEKASVVSFRTFLDRLPCTQELKTRICQNVDAWIANLHDRAKERGAAYYPQPGGGARGGARGSRW